MILLSKFAAFALIYLLPLYYGGPLVLGSDEFGKNSKSLEDLVESARYAINIEPIMGQGPNNTFNPITQILTHLPAIKFGLISALATFLLPVLYIVLILSLILFAITGSGAFLCSIVDCHNLFSHRSNTKSFFKKRDQMKKSWDTYRPITQAVHDSFEKFGDI